MSPFVTAYLKRKLHRLMLKQTRRFDGNPGGDASSQMPQTVNVIFLVASFCYHIVAFECIYLCLT